MSTNVTTEDWSPASSGNKNVTDIAAVTPGITPDMSLVNATDQFNISTSTLTSPSPAMVAIYYSFGTIGLVGNALVILVIASSSSLRKKTTGIYIVNQSCLDGLVSVMVLATASLDNAVHFAGLTGEVFCRLWQTKLLLWWLMLASTYNLVALSIERCIKVVHPLWHKVRFTNQLLGFSVASVWIITLIYQTIAFIPTSGVVGNLCRLYYKWPSPTVRKIYGISVVVMRFFIPLSVFLYVYARIAYVMHMKMKKNKKQGPSQQAAFQKWSRGLSNTIKTMGVVAAAYIFCWGFNQIYYLMYNTGYPADFTSDFYHTSVALVILNCALNPIIYAIQYKEFIQASRKLLCPSLHFLFNNSVGNSNMAQIATNQTANDP